MDPWFVAVLLLLGALVVAFVVSYNRFVAQRASIQASWAAIDVELQRRHDLVPNLVETVSGYAEHEQSVLREVTDARRRAVEATSDEIDTRTQARAEDGLTDRLTSLLALAEAVPELRADARFRDLQHQLVETEDRIAAARRLYNLDVAAYERRRRSVPSNLVASVADLAPAVPFEIQDAGAVHARAVRF